MFGILCLRHPANTLAVPPCGRFGLPVDTLISIRRHGRGQDAIVEHWRVKFLASGTRAPDMILCVVALTTPMNPLGLGIKYQFGSIVSTIAKVHPDCLSINEEAPKFVRFYGH